MLLCRLSLSDTRVLTYTGRIRRYCSEPLLAFSSTEAYKVANGGLRTASPSLTPSALTTPINATLSNVEKSSASLSPPTDLDHTTHHHEVETPCPLPSTKSISSSNQPVPELPSYSDRDEPCFNWGALDGAAFSHAFTSAYAEAIHWRCNLFSFPSGKAGTSFVTALASLYKGYGEGSAMESDSEPPRLPATVTSSILHNSL